MVRNVYLPLPENEDDQVYLDSIKAALERAKVNVMLYKRESSLNAGGGYIISVSNAEYAKRSTHPIFTVSVSNDTSKIAFASSAITESTSYQLSEGADVLILGSHGASIKPLSRETFDSVITKTPSTIVFSSPKEMLGDKSFVSYVNLLYQQGTEIILDGLTQYRFEITK